MAFTLVDCDGKQHIWYVGQPKPDLPRSPVMAPAYYIRYLQASGDELEYLISLAKDNLQLLRRDIATWRGEMAQFIYDNIP